MSIYLPIIVNWVVLSTDKLMQMMVAVVFSQTKLILTLLSIMASAIGINTF